MTEDEAIKAVAAKLTGEFYVGQRVRRTYADPHAQGTVVGLADWPGPLVGVHWDEDAPDDSPWNHYRTDLCAI